MAKHKIESLRFDGPANGGAYAMSWLMIEGLDRHPGRHRVANATHYTDGRSICSLNIPAAQTAVEDVAFLAEALSEFSREVHAIDSEPGRTGQPAKRGSTAA